MLSRPDMVFLSFDKTFIYISHCQSVTQGAFSQNLHKSNFLDIPLKRVLYN